MCFPQLQIALWEMQEIEMFQRRRSPFLEPQTKKPASRGGVKIWSSRAEHQRVSLIND